MTFGRFISIFLTTVAVFVLVREVVPKVLSSQPELQVGIFIGVFTFWLSMIADDLIWGRRK